VEWRLPAGLAAALALVVPPGAGAAPVSNVLRNPGFESPTRSWVISGPARVAREAVGAHGGRHALAVTATASRAVAVSFGTQGPLMRRLTFLSPITGALRGTFHAAVWLRASSGASGKLARIELDEFGGATPEREMPGAVTSVRLSRGWEQVSVRGSVERPDRIGAALTVGLDEASRGDTFFVDDARIGGDPLGAVTITPTGRWHWWAYALVWAVVLAGGAAWIAVPRLRPKTARAPHP
jgi:hypothetical protein